MHAQKGKEYMNDRLKRLFEFNPVKKLVPVIWKSHSRYLWIAALFCFVAVFLVATTSVAQTTIDRYVTIQPILVADDSGSNLPGYAMFENEFTKIYAQAGVAPVFLPTTQINSTSLQNVSGVAAFGSTGNGRSANANTINMWFVNSITAPAGWVYYGEAYIGANGIVINSTDVLNYNSGTGRLDSAAHELGHNFGLEHTTFGAGGSDNLMTTGTSRTIPGSIDDINPSPTPPGGPNLDQLTAQQVTQIRSSVFSNVVPTITVDTVGSTPYNTNDFFHVAFTNGPASAWLSSLTLDLSAVNAFFDSTDNPPGTDSSGFQMTNQSGLTTGDIIVDVADGSSSLTLNFADGSFMMGDSFSFGIDIDLWNNIDMYGATPDQLVGMNFSFRFNDGYGAQSTLPDSFITSSITPSAVLAFVGQPSYSGPPIAPGTIVAPGDPVPEPSTLFLLALGMMGVRACRRYLT